MKLLLSRIVPAALVCGLAFSAASAPLPPPAPAAPALEARADGRNAALYYWRAFYMLDRDCQKQSSDYLSDKRDAEWKPEQAAVEGLTKNAGFVEAVLTATRIDKCDFGIAYEEGFLALLPH